jgi:hypothetical protein
VSTKILSNSPFFNPICALSISGVEQQSKHLRKAENQLKVTTVPDFGFGSSLKVHQSFKSHQKFLFACRIRDHGFHCQKQNFTPSRDAICALSVSRTAWRVRCLRAARTQPESTTVPEFQSIPLSCKMIQFHHRDPRQSPVVTLLPGLE